MSQNFEQFGKYILLEKLAAGGMAEVFLTKSQGANGVNKFVAVKRILPQYSENEEFIDMFKEEAKIAINLNHSNVVPIYEFGVEKKQFYLVMEYVEGRNLRQIINELKKKSLQFSIEQIVYMIKEVAAGLDHAHRCIDGATGKPLNITHRDMSPQNVMVSYEGEVKVIDFGIAKAETQMEATKAGTLKGKFGYMSPEQADGQSIDLRTDIFSLGIVMWELLANDRLFTSNSEASILRKIRECQIPPIRKINLSVPPELERIVNKALAKDKSLRYQTSSALHKDLNRFLNTEYPDFSPHDFSVFIKNAFAETYQDSKKKLMTYANVQMKIAEDKTAVTQTMTYTGLNEDSVVTGLAPTPFMADDNDGGSLNLNPNSAEKVNLSSLQKPLLDKSKTPLSPLTQSGVRTGTVSTWGQPVRQGTQARIPQGTMARKMPAKDNTAKWITPLFAVVLLGASGWLYTSGTYKRFLPKGNSSIEAPVGPPVGAPQVEQKSKDESADMASSAQYRVTITSDPMSAQIFIKRDRQKPYEFQNSYTPSQLFFKPNERVYIKLVRGEFEYEGELNVTQDAMTLKPTLTRKLYGQLEVNIVNGGARPQIEMIVNGDPMNVDAQMLRSIRLPARVPIVLKAVNPFGGLSAQKTFMLQENQRQALELVLTPQK